MIDVICLAGFYTLRILSGGAATGIVISTWLMAFSMVLFLSLAFLKRYTELQAVKGCVGRLPGRGYYTEGPRHDPFARAGEAHRPGTSQAKSCPKEPSLSGTECPLAPPRQEEATP